MLRIESAVAEAEVLLAGRDVRGLIGRQRVLSDEPSSRKPIPPSRKAAATHVRSGGNFSVHVCSWHPCPPRQRSECWRTTLPESSSHGWRLVGLR